MNPVTVDDFDGHLDLRGRDLAELYPIVPAHLHFRGLMASSAKAKLREN